MKKKIFLVSTLLVVAMSAMFVSCKKDEPSNGCNCRYEYDGEFLGSEFISLSDMSYIGVKSCGALADYLTEGDGVDVSCTAD